ncbi:MAG: type I DNA topoisomerase [Acidimicrobiia bacterium]|nr:type I DNA topoisomerase [Acidimicrobiia bacterium]
MTKPLVIVESPAKARTISGFLGDGYVVESSIGHIRDLPRNAAEVPASHKAEPWARLGVDTENDFKPLYVVPSDKKDQVKKLKTLLKDASELYLATDEDREGESIAWHLLETLNPKVPVKRMVFHEITPHAIAEAIENSRDLDRHLVDAQEARRILDRLVGYEVSPVLWKMVRPKLSAGRVQSPAVRIIVERERERMQFQMASYWDLEGTFATKTGSTEDGSFEAKLLTLDGTRLAAGKDFSLAGELTGGKDVVLLDEAAAIELAAELNEADFAVRSVEPKPYTKKPAAPFRTSTLQQEAGRKLRFAAARTMSIAQRLYENGYITYMRTDSTTLSETAIAAARAQATELYGVEYVPAEPRVYTSKVKNAQEAHEAIRPAGDVFRTPAAVGKEVGADEAKLYELIWMRTIASQMKDAQGERVQVRLGAATAAGREALFGASGLVITFPGFMKAYVEGADNGDAEGAEKAKDDEERRLPAMTAGDPLDVVELAASSHETKPPARFTEVSLVRRLEELSIGRPSTYASIISTIQDRGYVWKKGTALVPSFTAFATITLLETHFPEFVDFAFTARMEDDLDRIARGEAEAIPYLSGFYFGNGRPGLHELVTDQLGEMDPRQLNSIVIGADANGEKIEARSGRFGPFLSRGEDTAPLPEDLPPDELTVEIAIGLLEAPSGDRPLGAHPESGKAVVAKTGRYGPYVMIEEPEGSKEKPKTASMFKDMSLDAVTLEQALQLLSLPRVVGTDPETDLAITAHNGRYGPYLKRGTDSRSLDTEAQLLTIDLDGALKVFAQPKKRRAAKPPLKELGPDPVSKAEMVVKDGRFGPYVTDGETNASLRVGDSVDSITPERGSELLADRRAKGPAKKNKKK